jgi:hypothetical protein
MLSQIGTAYAELFRVIGWQLGIAAVAILLFCLANMRAP